MAKAKSLFLSTIKYVVAMVLFGTIVFLTISTYLLT